MDYVPSEMGSLGAFCELNDNHLFIDTREITHFEAPYEHVKKMRASFYVLGPLVAGTELQKFLFRVVVPGDQDRLPHTEGLEKLGAEIELSRVM